MTRWCLVLVMACSSASTTAPPPTRATPPLSNVATRTAAHCPPPRAEIMETEGAPPWERDPLGRWPDCIETDDGARVTLVTDPSDLDGWRTTLVVEDGSGARVRAATRAGASFAVAPDGGVVIAHVEAEVSRFSPSGALVWKTKHPYCGSAEVAVGYDGRVVLGCGYSFVAYAVDGSFAWQKWPFGDQSVDRPLLARDGTMIVRSGQMLAKLDATGEIVWKVDTGWNRYVMPLGIAPNGNIMFRTSMAESHTRGAVHIYYESTPDELFEVTRDGAIASRTPIAGSGAWPKSQPWTPALRAGRLP